MAEANIEKFNEMAGKILNYLKLCFPLPASIGPESLRLQISRKGDWGNNGEYIEGEPETEDEQFFAGAIRWLLYEEYIFSWTAGSQDSLVLSERGLALAKATPEILSK